MRNLFLVVFLLSCFSFSCNTCWNKETEQKQNFEEKEEVLKENLFWINSRYLQCIERNLPCNCIDTREYLLLYLDSIPSSLIVYEAGLNQEELIVRPKSVDKEYEVFTTPDMSIPFSMINIKEDTLYFNEDNRASKFIKHFASESPKEGIHLLGRLNIEMVDNLVASLKFKFHEKLNISNKALLHCNIELGNVNLLYTLGDCDNDWVLDFSDNELLIYKYLNSCSSKTVPVFIDKELKYSIPRRPKK